MGRGADDFTDTIDGGFASQGAAQIALAWQSACRSVALPAPSLKYVRKSSIVIAIRHCFPADAIRLRGYRVAVSPVRVTAWIIR